jgi:hypothetical protein
MREIPWISAQQLTELNWNKTTKVLPCVRVRQRFKGFSHPTSECLDLSFFFLKKKLRSCTTV